MKRHKNWQEWGRRRALQHQNARIAAQMMNYAFDPFFRRDPIWNWLQSKHGHHAPFLSGSAMKIPLQYQEPEEQPCRTA